MIYYFLFVLFFQLPLFASELNINSIITLEKNVPSECGISIQINDTNFTSTVRVFIKKTGGPHTKTIFSVKDSKTTIKSADIVTNSQRISQIIGKKNKNSKKFEIKNITNVDSTNNFFQELLIGGGKVMLNKTEYEFSGPIDSKVRLEYLFCTGEMFLPNYQKK